MKHFLRLLSVLLCLCLMLMSLTSCMTLYHLAERYEPTTEPEQSSDTALPDEKTVLDFQLTEADTEKFAELLSLFKTLALEGTDGIAIEKALTEMEEQYYYIATQAQIAYLLYCCDLTDETASQNYLFASETVSSIYGDYIAVCRAIDESASPYREIFFFDWTDAELDEMRLYTDEFTALSQENDRLLVAYRELSETEFYDAAPEYLLELMANNTQLAAGMGFDSYYEYASERIYLRDYSTEDREMMRGYVSEYIVPAIESLYLAFSGRYEALNTLRQRKVYNFLYADYDKAGDYVETYLNALPEDMREQMSSLFESENSIFTDSDDAYTGAFTGYLYDLATPVCYFGPGYQSTTTVVHEMGHYYAACFGEGYNTPMDLAELQSQANEWLMLASLSDSINEEVYETLRYYLIYDLYTTILTCVIIDEFEECLYADAGKTYTTAAQLDSLMEEICQGYGGIEFINEYVVDIQYYWRIVAVESPVYYISYATSGVAALELYLRAVDDFDGAVAAYAALTEGGDPTVGFCTAVGEAGLSGAFDEQTYRRFFAAFS